MKLLEDVEIANRRMKRAAQQALASYLQTKDWDCFFTATFKRPLYYPVSALLKVEKALEVRDSVIRRSFIATEAHRSGAYHAHGLIKYFLSHDTFLDIQIEGDRRALDRLGWSNISYIKKIGNCAAYCSKYLTKETEVEYALDGDWNR